MKSDSWSLKEERRGEVKSNVVKLPYGLVRDSNVKEYLDITHEPWMFRFHHGVVSERPFHYLRSQSH